MINFYSHRARDSHSFKDNSKEAINFVLNKSYIAGVELDIRLTKDKKLVIYHNPFVILRWYHYASHRLKGNIRL